MMNRTRESLDRSPLLVFYELTRACDLACLHCRASAQAKPAPGELSPTESLRLVEQLAEFPDRPMLVLTGGDPLKRADIYDLTRRAVSLGIETSVTPSATPLLTSDAVLALREAGATRLAISIDGADAVTHDANRGVPGSFQHSLQMLRVAKRAGFSTQVNTTLTPANVDQVERMGDRFAELGIALWSVFFLVPVGRAEDAERLDANACEAAFSRLLAQSRRGLFAVKTTEAPHYRRFTAQAMRAQSRGHRPAANAGRYRSLGINDGKGTLFVGHRGEIHPSGFLPLDCGRFPGTSLVDAYQNSPVFRQLRDPDALGGKCGVCDFRKLCGGSRARAYAMTGDPMTAEPDCAYLPPRWMSHA